MSHAYNLLASRCALGAGWPIFTCSAHLREEIGVLGCPDDQKHKFDPWNVFVCLVASDMPSYAIIRRCRAANYALGAGWPIFTCSAHLREEIGVLGCADDQKHKFDPWNVFVWLTTVPLT